MQTVILGFLVNENREVQQIDIQNHFKLVATEKTVVKCLGRLADAGYAVRDQKSARRVFWKGLSLPKEVSCLPKEGTSLPKLESEVPVDPRVACPFPVAASESFGPENSGVSAGFEVVSPQSAPTASRTHACTHARHQESRNIIFKSSSNQESNIKNQERKDQDLNQETRAGKIDYSKFTFLFPESAAEATESPPLRSSAPDRPKPQPPPKTSQAASGSVYAFSGGKTVSATRIGTVLPAMYAAYGLAPEGLGRSPPVEGAPKPSKPILSDQPLLPGFWTAEKVDLRDEIESILKEKVPTLEWHCRQKIATAASEFGVTMDLLFVWISQTRNDVTKNKARLLNHLFEDWLAKNSIDSSLVTETRKIIYPTKKQKR